ncbi:MAG: nucleotidyltransferase domain-containing protein [Candidatus Melainabacteria bacterium]|jgi:uncharacterized protein|nr:nucleotidyltransferase domain-containing protein [Candidatus Melainabacteria bacterium]
MAKKFTRKELNSIIHNYLNALKGKINVDKAILFGSYAKGLEQDYSDIDLLIISHDLPKNKLKTSNGYFLDGLVGECNPALEVLGAHPENLGEPVSKSFYDEVLRTGNEAPRGKPTRYLHLIGC